MTFSSDEEEKFEVNSLADWMASLPQPPKPPPVLTVLSATRQPEATPSRNNINSPVTNHVRDERILKILEDVKQEQKRLTNVLEEVLATIGHLKEVNPVRVNMQAQDDPSALYHTHKVLMSQKFERKVPKIPSLSSPREKGEFMASINTVGPTAISGGQGGDGVGSI